jgi:hypothetical protein
MRVLPLLLFVSITHGHTTRLPQWLCRLNQHQLRRQQRPVRKPLARLEDTLESPLSVAGAGPETAVVLENQGSQSKGEQEVLGWLELWPSDSSYLGLAKRPNAGLQLRRAISIQAEGI